MKSMLLCVSLIALGFIFTSPVKSELNLDEAAGIWLFDEDDGEEALDSSVNGNHGTVQGAEWMPGKFGSALSFDGQSARVAIPDSDSLDLPGAWTITAWVFVNKTELSYGHILGKRNEGLNQSNYAFRINNAGTGWDVYFKKDGEWKGIWGQGSVKREEWYYITAVYDGESNITVYENGIQIGSGNPGAPPPAGESELHIGGWQANNSELLDGKLDEVAIFAVALTPEDIAELMESGIAAALSIFSVDHSGKLVTTWANIKK